MLIITADDFGLDKKTTDSILSVCNDKLITSTSAMVYMRDSVRAADIAADYVVEIGLHLNLTLCFSGLNLPPKLINHQKIISRFLLSNKFSHIIYNPFLRNSFEYVIRSQEDEFIRLYKNMPGFYNGHHHMHLCSNVILGNLLPCQIPIRRTFTYSWGEKNPINIIFRRILDWYINKKFITTDSFYSLSPIENISKLKKVFLISKIKNVELMVHPSGEQEYKFIHDKVYYELVKMANLGRFGELQKNIS